MLVAARRRFSQESYDNVGLRDVAGDVGVDVSLVNRYFGSKEELFKEVLRSGKRRLDESVTAQDLPTLLADLILAEDPAGDATEHTDRLLIILRSASSPHAAEIVRTCTREEMLAPVARLLHGDSGEMRAGLCLALLMGVKIQRQIMGVGALCACDPDIFRRKLVAMFDVALNAKA